MSSQSVDWWVDDTQELEGMLDDDQDMADMYLGRRQEAASNNKPDQSVRQEIQPPSPSQSAESMDDLEPSDFMGQVDSDAESEAPARPPRNTFDAAFIKRSTPTKRAQPPPQVCPYQASVQCYLWISGVLSRAKCRVASSSLQAADSSLKPQTQQQSLNNRYP